MKTIYLTSVVLISNLLFAPIATHAAAPGQLSLALVNQTEGKALWKKIRNLKYDFTSEEERPFSEATALRIISKLFDFYSTLNYLDEFDARAQISVLSFITQLSGNLLYHFGNEAPKAKDKTRKAQLKKIYTTKLKNNYILESLLYYVHAQGFGPSSAGRYLAFSPTGYMAVAQHFDSALNWQWQEMMADDLDDEEDDEKITQEKPPEKFSKPCAFCPKGKEKFFHKKISISSYGDLIAIVAIMESFEEFEMLEEFKAMSDFMGHNLTRAALLGDEFDQRNLRDILFMVKKFREKHGFENPLTLVSGCSKLLHNISTSPSRPASKKRKP